MTEPVQPQPAVDTQWRPEGPSGPRASFGRRLGAFLLDSLIIGIPIGILAAIVRTDVFWILYLAVIFLYFAYFEGSPSGQTIGKRILGIRVIDFGQGGSLGFGRAALRTVGRFVSQLLCYLGYLWMLWDREKQTWHDKIATSVVVPTQYYPVDRWP
jgi:uncharacterized RDD family membrane protein YckC